MSTELTPALNNEFSFGYVLPGGPFATSDKFVRILYQISCACFFPWAVMLDCFLSMFICTTNQSRLTNSKSVIFFCIKVLLLSTLLLCLTPVAMLAFIVWFPLQLFRPRAFSYICPSQPLRLSNLRDKYELMDTDSLQPSSNDTSIISTKVTCSILTANLCLMPNFIAHINNLGNSTSRGKKIASFLCGDSQSTLPLPKDRITAEATKKDPFFSTWNSDLLVDGYEEIGDAATDTNSITSTLWSVTSKEQTVSDVLPSAADFLCLQEAFDTRAVKKLLHGLKTKYPYIIYDVSWPIHNYRMTLLGSGLCIASQYPFIDIDFKAFPDGNRDDKLACKGLLMTKVCLRQTSNPNEENLVGYLATTHLQAWSRSSASNVRCKQLRLMEVWLEEFRKNSRKVMNKCSEKVLFDIVTGDFNFDKASHFDLNEQNCSFFRRYNDPCIDESGVQRSWVVGTELKQDKIYDECVNTPQGLQRMLISELERCQYVASTSPTRSSLQRVGDGKRRIDYILYKECERVLLTVKDFKFFTGLATLSDHIPIGMVFTCDQVSEQ